GTDKPGLMYHGAQHGNEVMGAAVVAYMAEHLLTNYDTDPEVRALVDNVEWYLLTVMNPDGYSDNDRYNANNADLNRNWGGPGANPNPFSQPETAAMRDFFLAHPNVRAHLDFHTFGRMILWPWGHTPDPCVDDPTFRMIGDDMAALIFQSRGTDYDRRGPIYTTIYPVNGDSVGYTYGELGVWGIGFELGYSHSMPTSEIIPTCQEMAPAMMYLAEFISDCNRNTILDSEEIIAGTVEDCNANTVPDECESFLDFDGDGLLDPCDPDLDADGVPNTSDVCDYTPIGTPVDEDGRPLSDVNGNCDTDLGDFIRVGYCLDLSGPGTPTTSSFCTTYFDYDDNGVIDLTDVGGFMRAFTGEPPAVR
ncbi:MAG: M14 family zinc carboxypeptidase, partial [Phycisphaerae bacterium]